MIEKLATLHPEIAVLTGAVICLLVGLAPQAGVRKATAWIAGLSLVAAALLIVRDMNAHDASAAVSGFMLTSYIKLATMIVGLLLLLIAAGVPDHLRLTRDIEQGVGKEKFDPGKVLRGEFYAFFLFSLSGVMLCAGAGDLVWLFLALELVSLPTYVMVSTAKDHGEAQESGVKYFFLGAMAAAVFLYGFTLIYGATGQTEFGLIRQAALDQVAAGGLSPLLITGLVLAVVGIGFKIAAVPMHFYVADVYQGAPTPVTAFLAFVPKTAGFVSIVLLLLMVRGVEGPDAGLPAPLPALLWLMAAATMTAGNVLGLLQDNVKRVLAYSSIAHTGYMLVGLLAMTAGRSTGADITLGNGIAAVLFYLIAYGLSTIAGFAVLGCLEARGEEAQTYDDISGLARRQPFLAGILLVSVLSLIGLPPMVGFIGKIYLFGSAIDHGYLWLVIIAVLNSAVSAVYYLRIAAAAFFGDDGGQTQALPTTGRRVGALVAAVGAVVLGVVPGWLVNSARVAGAVPSPSADKVVQADVSVRVSR